MSWHEHPTIFYDWIRHGEELDRHYAVWLVRKAMDCNCDTLAFCVHVGGYALWNSKITPRYPHIKDLDLIGELADLCRKQKLRFVPWWLGTLGGTMRIVKEHPDWQLVGPPKGSARVSEKSNGILVGNSKGTAQQKHWYVCYNTPYRKILYAEIREVLSQYKVDGIYFDQLPGSCYCRHCRDKYRRWYGRAMPVVEDEFFVYNTAAGLPEDLRRFRDRCVVDFCRGVRRIIDRTQPGVIYAQNWVRNQQSYLARGTADVLLPEFHQKDDLVPLGLRHRLTRTYFDHGAVWGNVRHGYRHDARHNPVRGVRLLLAECTANLAAPLMLDLCAMDFDRSGTREIAQTFTDIRTIQAIQKKAKPVYYAALLHSRRSHELLPAQYDEAFEGMYRLLLENHIPFEIVNEDGVAREELEPYRVLIAPDCVCLERTSVSRIRDAVNNGLGLIATYMTGTLNRRGSLKKKADLADLCGVRIKAIVSGTELPGTVKDPLAQGVAFDGDLFRYGSAVHEDHLAVGIPRDSLFCVRGGFVQVRPDRFARVVGWIHEMDKQRLQDGIYNRNGLYPAEPTWPLAVIKKTGKGRTAYFATQTDAGWRRAHAPELERLMVNTILEVGGPCPLRAPDCPPTVEIRLFHNRSQRCYQMILTNLTVNSFYKEIWPGVIRYVIPQKQVKIELNTRRKIKRVRSQLGNRLKHKIVPNGVKVTLETLDLYESIVLSY